ncbi:MAG: hypothetical protein RR073_01065 [Clostridia bacterium]
MDETKILIHATSYIKALSKGVNPITNEKVENDSIANDIRLQKCFAYVTSVLEDVVKNGGAISKSSETKAKSEGTSQFFFLTNEQKEKAKQNITTKAVGINKIYEWLSEFNNKAKMPLLLETDIEKWLVNNGYLAIEVLSEENKDYKATNKGLAVGIISLVFTQNGIKYIKTTCNPEMQTYIIDNANSIQNDPSKDKK